MAQAPARRTARPTWRYRAWPVAVVADEGVRHVHAVLGLDGDQAVALVVDELAAARASRRAPR